MLKGSAPPPPESARGSPAYGARRDSLSAGRLLPPPAWPLWRRRHRPAPGRSAPPPRPRCWPGGAPEPPRATGYPGPKLCPSLGSDPDDGPSLHWPPRPFGSWPIPELSESPSRSTVGCFGMLGNPCVQCCADTHILMLSNTRRHTLLLHVLTQIHKHANAFTAAEWMLDVGEWRACTSHSSRAKFHTTLSTPLPITGLTGPASSQLWKQTLFSGIPCKNRG